MTHDPTHLGALQTGYEQGHTDAVLDLRIALRQHGIDPETIEAVVTDRYTNPFEALFDDRREYVRQEVRDAFGSVTDEDGDDLFDGEVIDAILDAHADWLTAHQTTDTPDVKRHDLPQPADCLPGDVYLVRTRDTGRELVAAARMPAHPGDMIPWRALHENHEWHGDDEITIVAELHRRVPVTEGTAQR